MNREINHKSIRLAAIGVMLSGGLLVQSNAHAIGDVATRQSLSKSRVRTAVSLFAADSAPAPKSDGKCGEGKCGGDKKEDSKSDGHEGGDKCGGEKKDKKSDGKCGEGKCGSGH